MRIWDIHPGYLNRQSLLGEHRELHGIISIITNNKKGYAQHPETLRWKDSLWAIRQRHQSLSAEMFLRGYKEASPLKAQFPKGPWPNHFIDRPRVQFNLLKERYVGKELGRIPLPQTRQQLWAHHKFSVMARDVALYRELGRALSKTSPGQDFSDFADELVLLLRKRPSEGGLYNSLQHMWGYVSRLYPGRRCNVQSWPPSQLLEETQKLARSSQEGYLLSSTALSELKIWI